MEKNKKTPELRFAGFTGSWEQRKLGEFADVIGGGTPSTLNPDYWDGEINWYAPAEITDQIYIDSSERKITDEGFKNSSARMLPIGTVLFTSRAGIGKTAILSKKGCTNQGFQSIVPHQDKLDSYFIFSRTKELKEYGERIGAGSTFVEISGKQMAKMQLMMPKTRAEQKKIGEFFYNLDKLITLHQCKQKKLEILKKAMLNKMFPQSGEKIPQVRFPGFTNNWEQCKAIELFDPISERGYLELPVLSATQNYGMIKRDQSGIDIFYDKRNVRNYKRVLPGDFVIHLRSFQGGFAHSTLKGITSPAYRILRFKETGENFDIFWRYIFNSKRFIKRLESITYGIRDGRSINFNEFLEMEFIYPGIKEQKKIGEFLSNIDKLITFHHRKAEKLQIIKKSMLEKMFPQN